MRRPVPIFIFIFFSTIIDLPAQGWEAGIFFGISHYQGDLQRSHIEIIEAHHGNGLFVKYGFTNRLAAKAHFYQGAISGSDENYPNVPSVRERNLSFHSKIKELGVQFELTVLNIGQMKKHWKKSKTRYRASTYVFGGICGFHFNPKAYIDGYWHELQPLGTEGQGFPGMSSKYKLYQIGFPLGFGARYNLTAWSSVGFEVGYRKTYTDYLDDVSSNYPDLNALAERNPMAAALSHRRPEYNPDIAQYDSSGTLRGSVAWDDSYIFAGVTASIRLARRKN